MNISPLRGLSSLFFRLQGIVENHLIGPFDLNIIIKDFLPPDILILSLWTCDMLWWAQRGAAQVSLQGSVAPAARSVAQ